MSQSTTARATTFILREIIGEVLYFPVWWYSHGLTATARNLISKWFRMLNRLSIPILARTMGQPMYGDYSRSGRAISFFFRVVLLVSRLIFFIVWSVILIIGMLLWISGPIFCAAMLIRQVIPL